jgi:hypothetical protein
LDQAKAPLHSHRAHGASLDLHVPAPDRRGGVFLRSAPYQTGTLPRPPRRGAGDGLGAVQPGPGRIGRPTLTGESTLVLGHRLRGSEPRWVGVLGAGPGSHPLRVMPQTDPGPRMAGVACRAWFPPPALADPEVVEDADVLDAVAADPARDQGPAGGSIGP